MPVRLEDMLMSHRWPDVTRTCVHTTERWDMEETTHYTRCTGEGFIDTFHSLGQDTHTGLNLRQLR